MTDSLVKLSTGSEVTSLLLAKAVKCEEECTAFVCRLPYFQVVDICYDQSS